MNVLNLKVFTSRPRGAWMLFIAGVGVYGLLVLMETLAIGDARSRAIPWSWWWLQILVFSGISLGAADRHQGLGSPFSFALPGYRESLRHRSFDRAVRWGVIVSLWVFSQVWFWRQLHSGLPSDVRDRLSMTDPGVLAISLGTHSLQYRGFSMMAVLAACSPVPWSPLVALIMVLLVTSLHSGIPVLILIAVMFFVMKGVFSLHVGPAIVPILLACGWLLFLSITWAIYRRWDLGR